MLLAPSLLSLSLLSSPSLAQDFVTDIGDEVLINIGGGWNRTQPSDEGWDFLFSAGGDYNQAPMAEDFGWDDQDRRLLTGFTNLQDHGISPCPDGSWLHAASATLEIFDDSAYAWRYDAGFNEQAHVVIAERDDSLKHNDVLVACTPNLRLIGFTNRELRGGEVFLYDDALNLIERKVLEGAPTLSGTSAIHDPETGGVLHAGFELGSEDRAFKLTRYDQDLNFIDQVELDVTPTGERCYWSQGFMRLGDYYAVAHVCRDDSAGWEGDTGDVWLQILDADFTVLESHKVTNNALPVGGMRPHLARKGDQLLMSYDKAVRPYMHLITLNLAALGLAEGDDSGLPWEGDDTGGGGDAGKGCGCASGTGRSGGGAPLAALLLTLSLRRGPRRAAP